MSRKPISRDKRVKRINYRVARIKYWKDWLRLKSWVSPGVSKLFRGKWVWIHEPGLKFLTMEEYCESKGFTYKKMVG
jgi:hypothetical protein